MFTTVKRSAASVNRKYRKIPIISPGLIFVQKAFWLGLFSVEPIFGGAYYWKGFCVSQWVGRDNKNSLKHYENSLKQLALTVRGLIFGRAYYRRAFLRLRFEGLIFGRAYYRRAFLRLRFGALIFGRAYYRNDFVSEIWGAYIRGDLLSERFLCLRFGGLICGRAYYRNDFCV